MHDTFAVDPEQPSSSSTRLYCQACEKSFNHPSKLRRHLDTQRHKMFARRLELLDPTESLLEIAPTANTTVVGTSSEEIPDLEMTESDGEEEENDINPGQLRQELDYSPWSSILSDTDSDNKDSNESAISALHQLFTESEMDADVTSLRDYSPFPSKSFALLFMLAHSPRPIGESHLHFMGFICKQLDPSAPSLSQVKKFTLPGLTPPLKFYSPRSLPFYLKFLYGVPMWSQEREIYTSGALRKNMHKSAQLGELAIDTLSRINATIYDLTRHYNTLLVGFPLDTQVEVYGGVMDSNSKLVNCNQFVSFNYDGEIEYGYLKTCVKISEGSTSGYCIIQGLEKLVCEDQPILNDKLCPLLFFPQHFLLSPQPPF